jgi:hypothetical protein
LGDKVQAMKYFDLNIDKILENWEIAHAIRELIANAIDESALTKSRKPEIKKVENGCWTIRDYGRGIKYENLIQSENPEKLCNSAVIGKFGIGLKDALATFERNGIDVLIRSRFGDITLERLTKHSFDDLVTLHAVLTPPSKPELIGTECRLSRVNDDDVQVARDMFLQFLGDEPIEATKFGGVYPCYHGQGQIFINGMCVASESNFLFSYNITSLDSKIKKALNRERQNLGRVAYSDRVRSILLSCTSENIAEALAKDLQFWSTGEAHDELTWSDVQSHAVRILNSKEKVLFASADELAHNPFLVDVAASGGHKIIAVPDILVTKIQGISDIKGQQVVEANELFRQYGESFEFKWVELQTLSPEELLVWNHLEEILKLLDGRPESVRDIRISETMKRDQLSTRDTFGLWMPREGWIVIHRSQLASLKEFAATLLHEAVHAKYNVLDVSREFEWHLTMLSGRLAEKLLELTYIQSKSEEIERFQRGYEANVQQQFRRPQGQQQPGQGRAGLLAIMQKLAESRDWHANPQQELALLEQLIGELFAGTQNVLVSGEILSDEFQGALAQEFETTLKRIDQLRAEIGGETSVDGLLTSSQNNEPLMEAVPSSKVSYSSLPKKDEKKDSPNSLPKPTFLMNLKNIAQRLFKFFKNFKFLFSKTNPILKCTLQFFQHNDVLKNRFL